MAWRNEETVASSCPVVCVCVEGGFSHCPSLPLLLLALTRKTEREMEKTPYPPIRQGHATISSAFLHLVSILGVGTHTHPVCFQAAGVEIQTSWP